MTPLVVIIKLNIIVNIKYRCNCACLNGHIWNLYLSIYISGALVKLPAVPEKMRSNIHHTDKEKVETEIIKALISSYYDIVKKNYMDLVPKTIMHFLVNNFKEGLQNELVSQLYRYFLADYHRIYYFYIFSLMPI